jgi:hypothetical protein
MISQTIRSECVRFGGHVGIEVSYKILRLEVLKESTNSVNGPNGPMHPKMCNYR